MNLTVGSFVTHPMFPHWGRGVIAGILTDANTGRRIARVMWQSLNTNKLAFHTMEHLETFKDSENGKQT